MATESYKSTRPGDAKFKNKVVASPNPYGATKLEDVDMSVGNINKSNQTEPLKTSGIKIRGTGAATKGLMARGPMA
jgi:hypothetical protein